MLTTPMTTSASRPARALAVACRAALVAVLALTMVPGCGGGGEAQPDSTPLTCDAGTKACRADGLYTCDATGAFQLTEACGACEDEPTPHCAVTCGEPGVTAICEGDSIKTCATGTTEPCAPGTCVTAGKEAVCATKLGSSICQGRRADGSPYVLACADANGVAPDQACDGRTGT
ncbi:MAG: hypothetical protein H0X17_07950, partial [Deltaproteobacteria bacterium]|nr:hypothetical protein [Deltaproteobacteria bacterium]